jgi:hypothetical protein
VKERITMMAGLACGIMLQVISLSAAAQTAEDSLTSTDTVNAEEKNSLHSLYAGAGYGSNMIYLGTTMSQDHPFGYSSVSYGLADKFYFTAAGYTISGFSPFLAYYSLGMSYNHTFNSWFDISTSLSHYNVAESLRDTLFNNFTYADATLGFDWRILYSRISVGELFSEGSQFYFQTRHSRYFETPSFAKEKAFFSFDPYVNLLFGTMVTIETSGGTATTLSPGYRPWRKNGQGSSTTYTEYFGLMEIDFGLPIAFSYDFFTIEIEPGYVLPFYSETESAGMEGFLIMASAFFRIF